MSERIDVNPATLKEHAGEVRTLMTQLDGAAESASDTFDLQLFGVILVGPAQVLQGWTSSAKGYLSSVVQAGNEIAHALDSMADEYSTHEARRRAAFAKIHGTRPTDGPR